VAHEAARNGTLPEGFKEWALADQKGWTVAHEAAQSGIMGNGMPRECLEWKDFNGVSVREILANSTKKTHPLLEREIANSWLFHAFFLDFY
jgi:hypothetical protein